MGAGPNRSSENLTEREGMLLALALREQPVTAYQLMRIFADSPVSSINTSKGQVYPAIARLRARGLLNAKSVADDRRGTEELSLTRKGTEAVRRWVREIEPAHIVLDDPLRTRILSFDVLTRSEKLEWIAAAKALVWERQQQLDEYSEEVDLPYHDLVYRSAAESLRLKADWLDEMMRMLARGDALDRDTKA
jgi:DNA-binding PadR family transcriptional regulator